MRPEWEYVPEGFERRVQGWDAEAVEAAYRQRWAEFVAATSGPGPLGVAHEVPLGRHVVRDDPGWHNVVLTFGYVLARACRGAGRLSLLDWGGGPGHYCVLARALLPELALEYHSRDLGRLAKLGREVLPEGRFHDDDACLERTYDLVVASDSIQYAPDFASLLGKLGRAASPWLYIAQLPLAETAASFVVLQRPDAYGYETEYLGWVVSRSELYEAARAAGLRLEREFVAPGSIDAEGAPERPVRLRSFLFRRS